MSILDAIQNAEDRAEQIIQDAREKSRDIIRESDRIAKEEADQVIANAVTKKSEILDAQELESAEHVRKKLEAVDQNNQKIFTAAEKNIPKAVSIIMKRFESL
ncbi:MAG: hypothetical protein GX127_05865 [Eubacteriaceae bacterium]|jgi:vacuolar-type H+-ATPase subunit H|nr:hypothetical protein [Eubacteriaceae bacterium]